MYIEAFAEPHVLKAIEGIQLLLPHYRGGMMLVPVVEMTHVLEVKSRHRLIQPGSWVRMRRGVYKGDLAEVREVLDTEMKVRLSTCAMRAPCGCTCARAPHALCAWHRVHRVHSPRAPRPPRCWCA